jgi:hypothetical protein
MMRKLAAFALLAPALAAGACEKSPTGPSGGAQTHTVQPPDESGYEPLGTRHYLVDPEGRPTTMWAELLEIKPLRGSRIVLIPAQGPPDCSRDCYAVRLKFGIDEMPNPLFYENFVAFFENEIAQDSLCSATVYLGQEGECGVGPGPGSGGSTRYTPFTWVPTRLTVRVLSRRLSGNLPNVPLTPAETSWATGYQLLR